MAVKGMEHLTEFISKWERRLPGAAYMARVLATMLTYQDWTPEEFADSIEDAIRLDKNNMDEAMTDWRGVCEKLPESVRKAGTDGV